MFSPFDAEEAIRSHMLFFPTEDCPLEYAGGRVLRAPVETDRDLPPFDRVMTDGYAMRLGGDGADGAGRREWRVTGRQSTGMIPLSIDADDECVEVSAGAALPSGANTVAPREEVVRVGGKITITGACAPGRFVRRRGADRKQGGTVCAPGARISSGVIAAAAACGCASVRVSMVPRIAIVTAGDEFVDVSNPSPSPHQTRRSVDRALRAALIGTGYARVDCVHVRDVGSEVVDRLKRVIAEHDIVITTGGVSKGRVDSLAEVFARLGMERKVEGVAQRPGKTFWMGVTVRGCVVFGLPDNAVSSYVCLHRFVLPALAHASRADEERVLHAMPAGDFEASPAVTSYAPVRVEETADGARIAHAVQADASGEIGSLAGTDGFVELPPGWSGGAVRYFAWR